jgi:hypothetical protein
LDFNTILVVMVDGGLVLFFIYALVTLPPLERAEKLVKRDKIGSIRRSVVSRIPLFNVEELRSQHSHEPERVRGNSTHKKRPNE